MPSYAERDRSRPTVTNAGTRAARLGGAEAVRPTGISVPGLDAIQAMFDQSERVQSLAATAQLLNGRSAKPPQPPVRPSGNSVAQRVVKLLGAPVTELRTIQGYKAYEQLPVAEQVLVDREFVWQKQFGDVDAKSEDALIAELQRLAHNPMEAAKSSYSIEANQSIVNDANQSIVNDANQSIVNDANQSIVNEAEQNIEIGAAQNSDVQNKDFDEKKQIRKLPDTVIYSKWGTELAKELPDTFRKASFDDTKPMTLYRLVSSDELKELRETIQNEGKPIFKSKEGKKGDEKFFGVNKRYVWSGWAGKGKRAQQHPELLKVVLRPGVREAFLHNPEIAGLSESAKDVHRELKGLNPVHKGDNTQINIKSESVKSQYATTSLTYGFRGFVGDNTALETLANYIVNIEIVTGDELTALKDPKTKWKQVWD